ncbi:putative SWI/SNF-related matrix-associated actin-dependent regulator of chromatin subfamily A member 3-like 3 [Sesamum indicum]|uniref:SWI/SNF-related matrix-associated actin-dependent regulator of chromatin subfamily A member 3-like 3 n=1 Tax=Sesamum indicum TaxID=4182 RepID=A0A6I9TVQ9_SESIN|nr:putative SWI/SNF-related matrix-associated actin-dependent regulator of chromatin subfamily A member 3-like 3 [Sesamum indicum]
MEAESAEEKESEVKAIVGSGTSETDIRSVLSQCGNNHRAATDLIVHSPSTLSLTPHFTAQKTLTSVGVRISTVQMNLSKDVEESEKKPCDELSTVKQEPLSVENGSEGEREKGVMKKCGTGVGLKGSARVNEECDVGFVKGEVYGEENQVLSGEKSSATVGSRRLSFEEWLSLHHPGKKQEEKQGITGGANAEVRVKEEPNVDTESKTLILVKEEAKEVISVQPLSARKLSDDEYRRIQSGHINTKPKRARVEEMSLSSLVIEDGDFPEEPDWLLVGRTVITGLSTTKGRKLENNEIVHFAFPNADVRSKSSSHFMSAKASNAASAIVRFSTKRFGEIGRLPMEWAKCLVPLVNSSKVKVLGRCIAAPVDLHLMQEIMLYVSFYIHHSVFLEGDKSSWKLEPTNIDATTYPLLTLFKLLKVKPSQKAEFTPDDLDSRKRSLKLDDDSDDTAAVLPLVKKRKGCQLQDQNKDEQAITETSLNKLVGAVDMYNLEEMEPPETLTCDLRPYQKQALYWMSELETGASAEETEKTLHPCWAAYRVCDERAPAIYVNMFSGEATTQFPSATQMARGGILADAMGLGKTVMTIALILARRGRGTRVDQQVITEGETKIEHIKISQTTEASKKANGGTLIVCPMALLGQWKDELETHSKPDSISVFVHYGGERANDPKVIAEPDVVLTTYGVLTSAYKNDSINSIFHQVEWYRVVLDEAHTIKSSKTQGAQAAFGLSSYCRWCLTGTPLQNNLEDLYSLLCFLHVEPWCNWAWWNKLIQRPYENGDKRGLKLVKAILRPLMLRRTKESKDKEGRPILVLPPTDIQVVECEQSEAEHDFYGALFKRSKVQFDQFVAQGKVLHNYANILELLLRLRQCCNHPFLVMSRGDTQEYADLNKLARRFLQSHPDSTSQTGPSRAYVEEVVEGLRNGENAECPICLESADDPVLTPCAHRMCRECLLSSWRSTVVGLCPICRQVLSKTELITCPTASRFRIDVEKNWKESSKISKLLDCLEHMRNSGSGEKSIIFSQWTSFLDLLEIPLKRRNFGFLRFDGKLAQKQREKVLHEFAETKHKRILLMSLKAGGVGLNLTAASNVFLMDPWWNPAVEEQAIMRIHRIGQKRIVRVRRFIVKDTVEERMQQVQARKQRMIAGALTDEEVRSARIEELKMLFR